jgi:nitroreductase
MSDGDAVLRAIRSRRSVGRVSPEPLPRELVEELLAAAASAPNHHLTGPWRFIVLAGDARREVGAAHARAARRERPDISEESFEKESRRLERAPVVIVCCVASGDDPVEAREDRDAVAAAIENLLLAAQARGLGAMWRTGVMVDEPEVRDALGLAPRDEIVGFVYLGRPLASPPAAGPPRGSVSDLTTWKGW